MPKQYNVRGVPDEVDAAILRLFPGEKIAGHASPRMPWMRALFAIGALGLDQSDSVFSLWQSALRIATHQRGEDDIRPTSHVKIRMQEEIDQFEKNTSLNRLSNVLYYAVQVYVQDNDFWSFERVCNNACTRMDISMPRGLRIAAAKYHDRSLRPQKNVIAEDTAMNIEYNRGKDEY